MLFTLILSAWVQKLVVLKHFPAVFAARCWSHFAIRVCQEAKVGRCAPWASLGNKATNSDGVCKGVICITAGQEGGKRITQPLAIG